MAELDLPLEVLNENVTPYHINHKQKFIVRQKQLNFLMCGQSGELFYPAR